MKNLKTVLESVSEGFLHGGGGVQSKVRNALREHRRKLRSFFTILTMLLAAVSLACVYLMFTGSSQWHQLAAFFGIGAGGVIEAFRRTWKDWSQTELLLILIEDAGEAEIAGIIKKLTTRL